MDNNNSMAVLVVLAAFYVFAFVFSFQSLAEGNVLYIVLALVGFALALIVSIMFGLVTSQEGARITLWFFIYAGIVAITTVWYITKLGVKFGFL